MSENVAQSLEDVAKALNLPIRDPKDYSHERYVSVKPEKLVKAIKKLKADYGVFFLSTIPAFEADDGYTLPVVGAISPDNKTIIISRLDPNIGADIMIAMKK